ncbi:hypothetical protein EBU95_03950 [bacterium]|nr:hypothetical protein [bacterium]
MKPTEVILRLDEIVEFCTNALKEAAQYANKDDVNGEAGNIAKIALEQLYYMHVKLTNDIIKQKNKEKQ